LKNLKVGVYVALRLEATFSIFHFCISLPKKCILLPFGKWQNLKHERCDKTCETNCVSRPVLPRRIKSHGRHGGLRQQQVLGNVKFDRLLT